MPSRIGPYLFPKQQPPYKSSLSPHRVASGTAAYNAQQRSQQDVGALLRSWRLGFFGSGRRYPCVATSFPYRKDGFPFTTSQGAIIQTNGTRRALWPSGCGHEKDGSASTHRSIVCIVPISYSLPTEVYLSVFNLVRTLCHAGVLPANTAGPMSLKGC